MVMGIGLKQWEKAKVMLDYYFSVMFCLRSNRGITAGFTSRTISYSTSYGDKINYTVALSFLIGLMYLAKFFFLP